MTLTVLGIDPGGKSTGLVLRRGVYLVDHRVVTSVGPARGLPEREYLTRVRRAATELSLAADVVAVESVTPPRGFKNGARDAIQPGSLIGVSAVAGFLLALFDDVVLVAPARNGSRQALTSYPGALVGLREKVGGGVLRHARSAWDVAGAVRA